MGYRIADLSYDDVQVIKSTMKDAGFDRVYKEDFSTHNAKQLDHWLTDGFMLFRHQVSRDDFVAIDLTKRGDGQFLAFAKASADSDDYVDGQWPYYLTFKQADAIIECIRKVQYIL
jgi:hypothetical protein